MEVLSVSEPPKRVGGGKVSWDCVFKRDVLTDPNCQVESVDELVAKLKDAGLLA